MLPFEANKARVCFGRLEKGWAYDNADDGAYGYHANETEKDNLPDIGLVGSVITMTLDLTQNLSFWLEENRDDGTHVEKFQVFDNMLMEGDTKMLDRSFAPAVSLWKDEKIEFLCFNNNNSSS